MEERTSGTKFRRTTGIAVACPFCITMFEDAKKTLGQESFAVKDIAEIVAEGL
ncbi:MAG: hypothetical protein HYW93_01000 [Thaumarchaeota archaeon]|nr:hypothetical protein [Nitrososphaerota archaeon]